MSNTQYFICTSHTEREESEHSTCYFDAYDFIKDINVLNDNEALGIFISFNHDAYKDILISNREKEIEDDPEYFARYGCDDIDEYKKNLIVQVKMEIINRQIEHGFLIAKTMEIFPSDDEKEINKIVRYYLFKKAS